MTVGIVGLGLIGGSMARAVKRAGHRVYGMDIDRTVVMKAKLLEIVDQELTDDKMADCEVIILGIYPGATLKWLEEHGPRIPRETVVMDTCGVKRAVCGPAWEIAAKYGFTFVGGHPMEGAAKIGFDHSDSGMFNKASMILCPPEDIEIEQMKRLKDVLDSAGFGRYEMTTPEHHDEMIALTSQLAHVVSSAYVMAPNCLRHQGYSAGSLRDMTRVAYLNETMWSELFLDNPDYLAKELDGLIERLGEYRDLIRSGDEKALTAMLLKGRTIKERMNGDGGRG